MPVTEPGKIRNIAVAGHRGVGKTSLVEALLFQAGKTSRLGSIEQGTTVADWDDSLGDCGTVLRVDSSTGERFVREPFDGTVRLEGHDVVVVTNASMDAEEDDWG